MKRWRAWSLRDWLVNAMLVLVVAGIFVAIGGHTLLGFYVAACGIAIIILTFCLSLGIFMFSPIPEDQRISDQKQAEFEAGQAAALRGSRQEANPYHDIAEAQQFEDWSRGWHSGTYLAQQPGGRFLMLLLLLILIPVVIMLVLWGWP